ncbi:ATP-binding cassette domain-containing protein [Mangrovicoccus sp. HB182678]|uniref:ATP-binding cassette domain-containing protein n=1 Tax=Mangrovicoccus algicola TaxID=2771008 RepID=A0A8J7CJD9_9RHOB|nr:ATP-binding cassette domain-containing protein [Mangrovicoccus algicola]
MPPEPRRLFGGATVATSVDAPRDMLVLGTGPSRAVAAGPGRRPDASAPRGRAALLRAEGLGVEVDGLPALDGLDLELAEGTTTLLLGREGAGRGCALRAIMGLVPLRAGRIDLAGLDLTGLAPAARARAGLAWIPADGGVFGGLSVAQNLRLGPGRRRSRGRRDRLVADFPELAEYWHRPAALLGRGQRQLLGLARAAEGMPRLYLIDAPAPELGGALARLQAAGTTIVMSAEGCGPVRAAPPGTRAALIEAGRCLWCGPAATLLQSPALMQHLRPAGTEETG